MRFLPSLNSWVLSLSPWPEAKKKKVNLWRNVTPIVESKHMPYVFGLFSLDAWALLFKCSEDT